MVIFVHYMQYLNWCIDLILTHSSANFKYIIVEPENKSNTRYVKSFLEKILRQYPNIKLVNKHNGNNFYKKYKYQEDTINSYFILGNTQKNNKYLNWFPNNNSSKMRDLFFRNNSVTKGNYNLPKQHDKNNIKIGLVNRKKNRILTNHKRLRQVIKKNLISK